MTGIALSDVLFPPQANHNFSRILGDLRRTGLSVSNRLRSIRHDADFVRRVADALARPLVANERCGSWYVHPDDKAASAYFKSTDGHTGQWSFSARRLNLHLLGLIGEHDGCIIVDSTRRGKSMPDALSKTVPIWCCVLNRALFPGPDTTTITTAHHHHDLFTPPSVVSASEASQMLERIPAFVDSLLRLGLDLHALAARIHKPLRPLWVTQDTRLAALGDGGAVFDEYHPVICCTSSRRVVGADAGASEGGWYVQGAGDDSENWARGLTAPLFWAHADRLLAAPEADLPDLIAGILQDSSSSLSLSQMADGAGEVPAVRVAPMIYVGKLPIVTATAVKTCLVELVSAVGKPEDWVKSPSHLRVGLGAHKVASRNLRHALGDICSFASAWLRQLGAADGETGRERIVIACETGRDLSVGAALAICCWCFDGTGQIRPEEEGPRDGFNKDMIRARLSRIMTAFPEANVKRPTLQSVNSFLMDWRR